MVQTKTKVTVFGKEYCIVSDESKEYVQQIAIDLDERLKKLNGEYLSLSALTLTTLAALNLTDEYLKTKSALEELKVEVEGLRERVRDMHIKQQVEAPSNEQKLLRERVERLEMENERLKQGRFVSKTV